MKRDYTSQPKGCREFKAVLDSGDVDSLSRAFVHELRAVSRAAERKLRKLAKLQTAVRDESKAKK